MSIRRIALVCILSTLSCLWSGSAIAGEIGKGSLELALAGGFEHRNLDDLDANLTRFDLGTRLTYSITSRFGAGGTIAFSHLGSSNGADATSLGAAADLVVNFSTSSSVVPFGQLSVGLTNWSGDLYRDSKLGITLPFVGAGFRTLLGDHASVNVLAGYRYQKNVFGVDGVNAHDLVVSFGVSVFPNGIQ